MKERFIRTRFIKKNETMSVTPMPYFQTANEEFNYGIIIDSNCSNSQLSYCFIKEAPSCVNNEFAKIPDDLIFQHKNMTKMIYLSESSLYLLALGTSASKFSTVP